MITVFRWLDAPKNELRRSGLVVNGVALLKTINA